MPSGIDSNDPVYASLMQKLRDEQHDPHSAEVREPTHAWGVLPDLIGVAPRRFDHQDSVWGFPQGRRVT